MDDIGRELDQLALEFFELLERLQEKRQCLNTAIRDGHLNLSKARYSMGNKSVGALQYSHKMDCALYHVECDSSKAFPGNAAVAFTLQKGAPGKALDSPETLANVSDQEESSLRRRTSKSNSRLGGRKEITGIEDLCIAKDDKSSLDRSSKYCIQDPLKWFGILVPGCLKTGQRNFQNAIELSCEVTNLEFKLSEIIEKFKVLKARKLEMNLEQRRSLEKVETQGSS